MERERKPEKLVRLEDELSNPIFNSIVNSKERQGGGRTWKEEYSCQKL